MARVERKVTVMNRLGLHARPASRFAQLADSFESEVWLVKEGKAVDGKSILEVLTISCPYGTELLVRADGPDAEEAVASLCTLIEGRFGEID